MRNPEVEGMPQVGVWYWVPLKACWIVVMAVGHDADHVGLWRGKVAPMLADEYGLSARHRDLLLQAPRGIPRGRVTCGGGVYAVLHGADTPAGCSTRDIIDVFGLSAPCNLGMVVVAKHPHERRVPADIKIVRSILGLGSRPDA